MYPGLNGFRAFAFFAVFFFHTYKLHAGYLGVPAFFVLSGFLLTPILVEMKEKFQGKDFFLRFYGRRALRIFPLYYFYLFAGAILCLVVLQWENVPDRYHFVNFMKHLPEALFFLVDFIHATDDFDATKLMSHFWSLAVEEQFYLVWPLVIFLASRKTLKWVLIAAIVSGPFIRWFIASDFVHGLLPVLDTDVDARVYFLPFSHIEGLALGGYFALYRKSGSGYSVWMLFALAYVLGVSTTWFTTGTFKASALGYGPFFDDSAKHIWGYTIMNLAFANAIIHIRDRKFLPFLFENRVLDYLGKISYGLYVYHFGSLFMMDLLLGNFHELIRFALALVLTIAVSVASYELMEKRFLTLKDRFFAREGAENKSAGPSVPSEAAG